MRSSFLCFCISISLYSFSQSFEGRLTYLNYQVIEGDTIESSTMIYWLKDHLYKHQGTVAKMPLVDFGTLYADADKMSRMNMQSSGTIEIVKEPLDTESPNLKLSSSEEKQVIVGYTCEKWELIDSTTHELIATLWVTEDITNEFYDQFVELFNYQSTLFPCPDLSGWILKREDFRRENEVFVTEVQVIEEMELSVAEMMIY